MKIEIDILTSYSAFWTEENTFDSSELKRIMNKVTNEVLQITEDRKSKDDGEVDFSPQPRGWCKDTNGNTVGTWTIISE